MSGNFIVGQYIPGTSPLHKLDPRTKLIMVFAYTIGLFFLPTWLPVLLAGIPLGIAVYASRLPWRYLLLGLRPLWILLVITFLLHLLGGSSTAPPAPEDVWATLGPWTITGTGAATGFTTVLRLAWLFSAASLLTLTTSPMMVTHGLERLLGPLKRWRFPAHELAMMTSIALRFIPTLQEEMDKIIKAQAARGSSWRYGSWTRRAQALVALMVPLLLSALRRADDLAVAMEARGYQGGEGRTAHHPLQMTRIDRWLLIITALAGITIILWRWA
ncbi:energy-coupling factor transporter transmembrane component T family protein [Heliophilum fasciatum]|uniref:Energy-coupling factor transport system permease protein n=1 Tax=Heliophilum fasciatum TaxID=35700 RepID=A0A4R2RLB7_9FIRM|nr:energy-coupling factor transporter transmembrane component T [Heliophilum fasciatum]MCW2277784.1 energy-coupling factor transport system permease protein [Heliophilum fasciatum]TCP64722.1 energy-coupling factor transport system permease protein [Heliophilum fasciatum]